LALLQQQAQWFRPEVDATIEEAFKHVRSPER
jgi:hypothetical protein